MYKYMCFNIIHYSDTINGKSKNRDNLPSDIINNRNNLIAFTLLLLVVGVTLGALGAQNSAISGRQSATFNRCGPTCGTTSYTTLRTTTSVSTTKATTSLSTTTTATTSATTTIPPHNLADLYVSNGGGSISAINTSANLVLATINTFNSPNELAWDSGYLYVSTYTNNSSGLVYVINRATYAISTKIIVGADPTGMIIYGSHLYVTDQGTSTVSVINTTTNKLITNIPVQGDPTSVDVSPQGLAYVTNYASGTVSVINTATNKVITTIPIGSNTHPASIEVSPNKPYAYVANFGSGTVSVINTQTNLVANTIKLLNGAQGPAYLVISPNGAYVGVIDASGAGQVAIINAATYAVTTAPLALTPFSGMAFSNNNAQLAVTNLNQGTVSILSVPSASSVAKVTVSGHPSVVLYSPNDNYIYVAAANALSGKPGTFSVISGSTYKVLSVTNIGYNPDWESASPAATTTVTVTTTSSVPTTSKTTTTIIYNTQITIAVSPSKDGFVSAFGTYQNDSFFAFTNSSTTMKLPQGANVYITANSFSSNFIFANWVCSGTGCYAGTNANEKFEITSNIIETANFKAKSSSTTTTSKATTTTSTTSKATTSTVRITSTMILKVPPAQMPPNNVIANFTNFTDYNIQNIIQPSIFQATGTNSPQPVLPEGCTINADGTADCNKMLTDGGCVTQDDGSLLCSSLPDGCSISDASGQTSGAPAPGIDCDTVSSTCDQLTLQTGCSVAAGSDCNINPADGSGICTPVDPNAVMNCQSDPGAGTSTCTMNGVTVSQCTSTIDTENCQFNDPECALGDANTCDSATVMCVFTPGAGENNFGESCTSTINSCSTEDSTDCTTQMTVVSCMGTDMGPSCMETDTVALSAECVSALNSGDNDYFNTYCQPPNGDYANCQIVGSDYVCTANNGQCNNGALDFPSCGACPSGMTLADNGNCVTNTVCNNGTVNPPDCNQCGEGESIIDGSCSSNTCFNGATNPPDCTTCSDGLGPVGDECPGTTSTILSSIALSTSVGSTSTLVGSTSTAPQSGGGTSGGGSGGGGGGGCFSSKSTLTRGQGLSFILVDICDEDAGISNTIKAGIQEFYNTFSHAPQPTPLPLLPTNEPNSTKGGSCGFYLVVCWTKS
jgi:YVTN family beta-propeller protein